MNAVPSGEQTGGSSLVPATHNTNVFQTICETAAIVLLAFWLLGIGINYTADGYIHILLGAALTCGVIRYRRRNAIISA